MNMNPEAVCQFLCTVRVITTQYQIPADGQAILRDLLLRMRHRGYFDNPQLRPLAQQHRAFYMSEAARTIDRDGAGTALANAIDRLN